MWVLCAPSLAAPWSRERPPQVDVMLGVISDPRRADRRDMLRRFNQEPGVSDGAVRVEFVFGDTYYRSPPSHEVQQRVAEEAVRHGDVRFVAGRENLPHVGKATEKSAAWWMSAPLRSRAKFFCKTDDDSLVHLAHLRASLNAVREQVASQHVIFSYIRWRGWLPGFRFQACGGGWGGPVDAINQMEDRSSGCELAEGPFPQGTGTLTCLSRKLALRMARSAEFGTFLQVARARNDLGTPCTDADACARQPLPTHMWHHEDAGISYNAFRAVLGAKALRPNVSAALVHLPEDGWIFPWFNPDALGKARDSSRAIVVHKVSPDMYARVAAKWQMALPAPALTIDCNQRCSSWGWKRARAACDEPPPLAASAPGSWRGFGTTWNGSLCTFDPSETWRCCFVRASDDH